MGPVCRAQPFAAGQEPPVHIAWCLIYPIATEAQVSLLTGWTLCQLPIVTGWSAVQLSGPPRPDLFCASCVHAAQHEPRWRAQGWG